YSVPKDIARANILYKEAADAQYWYACSLYQKDNHEYNEFLQCGVNKDKQSGLKYLRSAALRDNKQAIDLLNENEERIISFCD
ncbi:10039_t:CDS:2, partial [Scutellospora calospora]